MASTKSVIMITYCDLCRLVTRATIEERMMQQAKGKMVLEQLVVQKMGKPQQMKQQELDDLLRYGASELFAEQSVKLPEAAAAAAAKGITSTIKHGQATPPALATGDRIKSMRSRWWDGCPPPNPALCCVVLWCALSAVQASVSLSSSCAYHPRFTSQDFPCKASPATILTARHPSSRLPYVA